MNNYAACYAGWFYLRDEFFHSTVIHTTAVAVEALGSTVTCIIAMLHGDSWFIGTSISVVGQDSVLRSHIFYLHFVF